jgi:hypothetical protein
VAVPPLSIPPNPAAVTELPCTPGTLSPTAGNVVDHGCVLGGTWSSRFAIAQLFCCNFHVLLLFGDAPASDHGLYPVNDPLLVASAGVIRIVAEGFAAE